MSAEIAHWALVVAAQGQSALPCIAAISLRLVFPRCMACIFAIAAVSSSLPVSPSSASI
eukprot:COSAG01_NODE_1914_length_8922_cov_10.562734_1_plen_58_part_10